MSDDSAPHPTGAATRRRWLFAGAGAVALAAGLALRAKHAGSPESGKDDDLAGGSEGDAQALQQLWGLELPTPNGEVLRLASLKGRPLLLNFWATWCAPCVKEMPELDRFHASQRDQGWSVVGIAVDQADPVRQFLTRTPVSFPIGIAGVAALATARALGNEAGGLPFSVLIDAQGRIAQRKLGATTADELSAWARSPT